MWCRAAKFNIVAMAAGLPVGLAERDFWPFSRGKSGTESGY